MSVCHTRVSSTAELDSMVLVLKEVLHMAHLMVSGHQPLHSDVSTLFDPATVRISNTKLVGVKLSSQV